MTHLVKNLRNDHRVIAAIFNKSKNPELSIEEKAAFLLTAKTLLFEHIQKEDEELYPKLREASTAENHASEMADEFVSGMEKLGEIVTEFFDQNMDDLNDLHRNPDYSKIMKLLELRIKKEESTLYNLYDKVAD